MEGHVEVTIIQWVMAGGIIVIVVFAIATYRAMDVFKEAESSKRARIYERLDEVKKDAEGKFTKKDYCDLLHKQISADLTEIKTDVKILLRKGNHEVPA